MTHRLGRRKAQLWLEPLRKMLRDMRQTGEVVEAGGNAMMEMPDGHVRIDFCVEGFARMIRRVMPSANIDAVTIISQMLADDKPLTIQDVDAALACINKIEPLLARVDRDVIKSAVYTEQLAIELGADNAGN